MVVTLVSTQHKPALSVAWATSSDTQPDAFDNYRSSIADLYACTGAPDDGVSGFYSETRAWRFGASGFARGRSSAQTLTRTASEIRRSGLDDISIIVNLSKTYGDCDGRQTVAEAGSVQFRDLSRPSGSRVESIDTINLMTPRSSVPSWLLSRNVHGLVLCSTSAGGRLVASHLKTLADVASELSEEEGIAAIEATFVIAERFMGRAGPVAPVHLDSIHRTIRQRAIQVFDAGASDPTLNVAAVAAEIGVSRSALYRAFGDLGGVLTYVLHRRLDRALTDLRVGGATRVQIAAVAERYGFTSVVRFEQAFRDRFGYRAGDVGPVGFASRGGPLAANADGILDGAAHDVVLSWLRQGAAA
ncbi:helix-turn-helix domain-containing protein [soil metagenome]